MFATGKRKSVPIATRTEVCLLTGIYFCCGLSVALAAVLFYGRPEDPINTAKACITSALCCLGFVVMLYLEGPPDA